MATARKTQDVGDAAIRLERIKRNIIEVPIVGVSPLIPHNWSEKAKRLMRETQGIIVQDEAMGPGVKKRREPKNPEEEAEASLYRLDDARPGMPAEAFKAAMVGAARDFTTVTMVALKQSIFVIGEITKAGNQLVPIECEMTMREDTPRNANGNADLRYRYSLWPWSAILRVEFKANLLDEASVVALVDASGDGGVGDWRPSAPKSMTGTYGRYHVET